MDSRPIALVHEWLQSRSGSEKVFLEMADLVRDADLYALSQHPGFEPLPGGRHVATTVLDRPALRDRRSLTLPLMPIAWRALRRPDYDVVVTSSHAFARSFVRARDGVHLCYCHTPVRYAWYPEIDGRGASPALAPVRAALRRVDAATARRAHFAANSTEVAQRIRDCYRRDAEVIFPPVDVERFAPTGDDRGDHLLFVSRLVPYKRADLAIAVAEAVGRPLVIVGDGPEAPRIRALAATATVPVRLAGSPSDAELRTHYASAALLLFPAHEDFGIVPVEAQACGTPVVSLDLGGCRDTVLHEITGVRARSASVADLAAATRACLAMVDSATAAACREHAERFSTDVFRRSFTTWLEHHRGAGA